MGQFFRGTAPLATRSQIYQPNLELMGKVLGVVEGQIEKGEQELLETSKLLKDIKYLDQDKERFDEINTAYTNYINDISQEVYTNPLKFRSKLGNIKALSRQLQEDISKGELGAIQGNYKAKTDFVEEQKKRANQKDSGVNGEDISIFTNFYDKKFKGTNWSKTNHNKYDAESIVGYKNPLEKAEALGKGFVASSNKQSGIYNENGFYGIQKSSVKKVLKSDVYNHVLNGLLNDKEVTSYINQRVKVGATTKEAETLKLMKISENIASKYGYSETEKGQTSINKDSDGSGSGSGSGKGLDELSASLYHTVNYRALGGEPYLKEQKKNDLDVRVYDAIGVPNELRDYESLSNVEAILEKYKLEYSKYDIGGETKPFDNEGYEKMKKDVENIFSTYSKGEVKLTRANLLSDYPKETAEKISKRLDNIVKTGVLPTDKEFELYIPNPLGGENLLSIKLNAIEAVEDFIVEGKPLLDNDGNEKKDSKGDIKREKFRYRINPNKPFVNIDLFPNTINPKDPIDKDVIIKVQLQRKQEKNLISTLEVGKGEDRTIQNVFSEEKWSDVGFATIKISGKNAGIITDEEYYDYDWK